jgi:hypothetical protein
MQTTKFKINFTMLPQAQQLFFSFSIVVVTTEEGKKDCCVVGNIVKLIT